MLKGNPHPEGLGTGSQFICIFDKYQWVIEIASWPKAY